MHEIIRNVIQSGSYELMDILKKIDTIWLQGALTDEERTELVDLARTRADPENSYAPLQKQIDTLYTNMTEMGKTILSLTGRIAKLEAAASPRRRRRSTPHGYSPPGHMTLIAQAIR